MIEKLKGYLNKDDNKKLLTNFLSLFSLQGMSYILPLVTVPYLVRVIGPEKFGLLGFAGAAIGYFGLFIGFGFSLSATKQIAIVKDDISRVSTIFCSVISSQILLTVVSFLILTSIIFSFEKFQNYWFVYYILLSISFANIFIPVWFFQGMEKMKFITYLNVFSKVIFTVAIFVFVKNEEDFYYVPIFTFFGSVLTGIIALLIIKYNFKIRFFIPRLYNILEQFKESKHIFLSSLAGSSYTISITFILGLFTNNTIVGYFSGADKVIKAFQGLFQPVISTLYPHVNYLLATDKKRVLKFLKKTTYYVGTTALLISIITVLFAKEIIYLFLGKQYIESIILLQIMAIIPFLVALGSVFAILVMISFGKSKELSKIYMKTAIVSLISTCFLIYMFKDVGAAFAVVIAELTATFLMIKNIKKSDIDII